MRYGNSALYSCSPPTKNPVLIPAHSHSNDSEAQDLLLGVLLSLPLNLVTLGKVIPHSSPDLYVKDARLVETRGYVFQLDKLV